VQAQWWREIPRVNPIRRTDGLIPNKRKEYWILVSKALPEPMAFIIEKN
jgi:hypothetical protein